MKTSSPVALWASAVSDGRSAVSAIVIGEQERCRVSGGHKRDVLQGVDDRFRPLRAADGCIRKRLDGKRICANYRSVGMVKKCARDKSVIVDTKRKVRSVL